MKSSPLLFLWLILFILPLQAQLTIQVSDLPPNTPPNAPLYLAGNVNNWNPADPSFRFQQDEAGRYFVRLFMPAGELQFKVTRGNWATVEGNAEGRFQSNHIYQYDGSAHQVQLEIASWEDLSNANPRASTRSDNVDVIATAFNMPQLNRQRRIWVYLPPDYRQSARAYPVIYMHDAQNLFDRQTSFSGEWQVDESLNRLFAETGQAVIVVGIDNGGPDRLNEYAPWVHPRYGGGQGDEYTDFIVQTLKPYIDDNFRTLKDPANTAIIGSSMGGLVSMYAIAEYPGVFGKAGIFSPSFWFSEQAFEHVAAKGKQMDLKFYFLAGTNEGGNMAANLQRMVDLLYQMGYDSTQIKVLLQQDGAHAEWFWAREFPAACNWLFTN